MQPDAAGVGDREFVGFQDHFSANRTRILRILPESNALRRGGALWE
jgi:hypothetical protein